MKFLQIAAWTIIIIYVLAIILLYTLQTKLIFYPGKLNANYKFKSGTIAQEFFLDTTDGERINALFFDNNSPDVILYFHGNAGDLSGWQYVAEDFSNTGCNFMIIDYRGYGKSSGRISERGFYLDADAAYNFLLDKGFSFRNIIIYGRSIGSGVAVNLAAMRPCKGLILEAPFSTLSTLAHEKLPFFFPAFYLKYRFDNLAKIGNVKSPVIFLHGSDDTLIPARHSERLFEKVSGKKKMIVVKHGSHNDLHAFTQYDEFLREELAAFF